MNKQENHLDDAGRTNTDLWLDAITETMAEPGFTPEQLPGLWQRAEPYTLAGTSAGSSADYWDSWRAGVEAMYRRCETYPQVAKLTGVLSGMPRAARHHTDWIRNQTDLLVRCATPEQLRQALAYEHQNHPTAPWPIQNHILHQTCAEQLTGPVIEQLHWEARFLVGVPGDRRWRRNVGHVLGLVQQQLLAGDSNAWDVFCGIAEPAP